LANIEFVNLQIKESATKLEKFKDIEKVVEASNLLDASSLKRQIESINFEKIGASIFSNVEKSLNSAVSRFENNSDKLLEISENMSEIDVMSDQLLELKKIFSSIKARTFALALLIGVSLGVAGAYGWLKFEKHKIKAEYQAELANQLKDATPIQKLLVGRAFVIDKFTDTNEYKNILIVKASKNKSIKFGKLSNGDIFVAVNDLKGDKR
jgi:prefoldin subunit 5